MHTSQLDRLELIEAWSKGNPADRLKFSFPFYAGTGAQASAVVYMVLEPGGAVPTHTDSAEEVVLVLEGTIEGWVGDERGTLETGGMVLIPAMAPHGLRKKSTPSPAGSHSRHSRSAWGTACDGRVHAWISGPAGEAYEEKTATRP